MIWAEGGKEATDLLSSIQPSLPVPDPDNVSSVDGYTPMPEGMDLQEQSMGVIP